jgi:hypothetical protein
VVVGDAHAPLAEEHVAAAHVDQRTVFVALRDVDLGGLVVDDGLEAL